MLTQRPYRQRSLFGPLLLISIGIIWLLGNANIIHAANLQVLFRFWPVILIIIGVELIVGRGNPRISWIVSIAGIAVIFGLLLLGPALGLAQVAALHTNNYTWPLENTESAHVTLDLSVAQTTVRALNDSPNLIEADLSYRGDIDFNVTGGTEKTVTLKNTNVGESVSFWDFGIFGKEDQPIWRVNLNKQVALDLDVNSGLGSSDLDLKGMNLTGLQVNGGVGSLMLTLPSSEATYNAEVNSGTGSLDISIAEGAALNLDIQGGVGSVTINIPANSPVRLEAKTGVGSVSVPSTLNQISGKDGGLGDDGIWQSSNYETSTRLITIHYEGGVGGLTIQ